MSLSIQNYKIKELFGYWLSIKGNRKAPDRREIEPSAIKHLLCDMFILESPSAEQSWVRLSGTRVNAWFGHEMKGLPFQTFWTQQGRTQAELCLNHVCQKLQPALLTLEATASNNDKALIEMLLLPLDQKGSAGTRILGSLMGKQAPRWFGTLPIKGLKIISTQYVEIEAPEEFEPYTVNVAHMPLEPGSARPYGKFMVIDGGKTSH